MSEKHKLPAKITKIAAWSGGVLLALILLLLIFRDFVIKGRIEHFCSRTLGVEVSIEELDSSLFHGTVSLKGVQVANPEKFREPMGLTLDKLVFDLDMGTLLAHELVIEEITVENLAMTGEFSVEGKFNLAVINQYVQEHTAAPQQEDEAADTEETEEAEEESSRPILIRSVALTATANLVDDRMGAALTVPLSYSAQDIHLAGSSQSFAKNFDKLTRIAESTCIGALTAGGIISDTGKEVIDGASDLTKKVFDQTGKGVRDFWNNLKK